MSIAPRISQERCLFKIKNANPISPTTRVREAEEAREASESKLIALSDKEALLNSIAASKMALEKSLQGAAAAKTELGTVRAELIEVHFPGLSREGDAPGAGERRVRGADLATGCRLGLKMASLRSSCGRH